MPWDVRCAREKNVEGVSHAHRLRGQRAQQVQRERCVVFVGKREMCAHAPPPIGPANRKRFGPAADPDSQISWLRASRKFTTKDAIGAIAGHAQALPWRE